MTTGNFDVVIPFGSGEVHAGLPLAIPNQCLLVSAVMGSPWADDFPLGLKWVVVQSVAEYHFLHLLHHH